jgi:hypothetical protein
MRKVWIEAALNGPWSRALPGAMDDRGARRGYSKQSKSAGDAKDTAGPPPIGSRAISRLATFNLEAHAQHAIHQGGVNDDPNHA